MSDQSQQQLLQQRRQVMGRGTAGADRDSKNHDNKDVFGNQAGYSEPYWYQGFHSPYYKDTHRQFRARVCALSYSSSLDARSVSIAAGYCYDDPCWTVY